MKHRRGIKSNSYQQKSRRVLLFHSVFTDFSAAILVFFLPMFMHGWLAAEWSVHNQSLVVFVQTCYYVIITCFLTSLHDSRLLLTILPHYKLQLVTRHC